MNIIAGGVPGESVIRRPIFLVGTMRSGTTLLAQLLGRSPHIAYCPFELKDLWSQDGGIPMASPKTKDLTCPECSVGSIRPGMREKLSKAFLGRQTLLTGKVEGAFFLNKNPHLCNKLPLVQSLFPDARFIWIYRPLPQVAASIKRLFESVSQRQGTIHWWPSPSESTFNRCWNAFRSPGSHPGVPGDRIFPGGRIVYIAEYWLETNRAVSAFFHKLQSSQCITLKEEDLLADPAKYMATLAARLEIPYFEAAEFTHGLDADRNNEWPGLLQPKEIDDLIKFVELNAAEIDRVFMHGSAKKYLSLLQAGMRECRRS